MISSSRHVADLEAALNSIQLRYRRESNSFIFRVDGQRHVVSCTDDGVQILVSSGKKVSTKQLPSVLEFACLVNEKLDSGCILVDTETMEIRWRSNITLIPGADLRLMFVDRFVEVMQIFPIVAQAATNVLGGLPAREAMERLPDSRLNDSGSIRA